MSEQINNTTDIENGIEIFGQYDEGQLFFGFDYEVTDKIKVRSPSVMEVIKFGEQKYYQTVSTMCAVPSDMKSFLYDNFGLVWTKIKDFELFCMFKDLYTKENTSLLLGDLGIASMELGYMDDNEEKIVLRRGDIVIDEFVYQKMIQYIRTYHSITPKVEKAGNKFTRDALIQEDRERVALNKNKKYEPQLLGLIKSMLTYPGFKYKKSELDECGLNEFLDAVKSAQIYTSTVALQHGAYSGFVDTKKINKEAFNWMRSG